MRDTRQGVRMLTVVIVGALLILLLPGQALAHCDRVNGPVARAAREALDTGSFDTVAIWVSEEQAAELRKAFDQALPVYRMAGEAGELAEEFFMASAVRLHREAEGMSFTGLKPAEPPAADIAAADKALETGDLQPVLELLRSDLEGRVETYFQQARQAKEGYGGEDVAAGRDWADAYVRYIVYVHGLQQKIQAGPAHGVGE